jgi:citrate synthase
MRACSESSLIKMINISEKNLLQAAQAAKALGVSRATLYAYASRRLVRAIRDPEHPRKSLYDITNLQERHRRGRSRRDVALATLSFGEPILVSHLTRISDGRIEYRGHDAIALARTATLEEVAALLWQVPEVPAAKITTIPQGTPPKRCLTAIAALAEIGTFHHHAEAVAVDASMLLHAVAAASAGMRGAGKIHARMAAAWRLSAAKAEILRTALVLCADHELNVSTYAARVVASARAPLGACVLAGLAALTGPLHGGATDLVRDFLSTPALFDSPDRVVSARLARGEKLPGFGHRLYPAGDPRAAELLRALDLPAPWRRLLRAIAIAAGVAPNVDFALVAMEMLLKLPTGAAFAVFATGRTAGWIAHALEQWQEGQLIRPRATYVAA